jgi:hypothetical protein
MGKEYGRKKGRRKRKGKKVVRDRDKKKNIFSRENEPVHVPKSNDQITTYL